MFIIGQDEYDFVGKYHICFIESLKDLAFVTIKALVG